MRGELLIDPLEAEKPLAAEDLRELRVLAGFSQPALERCAGLRPGRVTSVENGRGRLRPSEWVKVKRLLFEEMTNRAREIAEHLGSEPAFARAGERLESAPP